ncbi:UTP--glucose-1-phosphate uridylyltransferase GalU [Terasakiella sp. A23]|uniref:UTP--glucose-1-phosphate uridylyltransferase GalU n=1 Tax=Terasakiella sp. FCG-A23 TaxID=3080561 RepID=UPI0029557A16|nr:UTP--glucose-1-phosphate uridylyltransferase GalU [Terasakiella sp. A23]MDV7338561.1 UTP--glucose-1-phosphate uridylyltransferase GalU [Terasakiella sp. A23]
MTKPVRKAVFPVGGLGTRFLPATKAMPKEMLPVVDKPLIQYAVEEAIDAGIEQFIFVTGRGKTALEDHFDHSHELEDTLLEKGKDEIHKTVLDILPKPGSVFYTRQMKPSGLGHAVWCAKELIGDEPFAVLLADDLVLAKDKCCLKQMIDVYNETGGNVVAIEEVPREETNKYGVLKVTEDDGRIAKADGLVEKPKPEDAPSNLSIIGRYVLQPEVFKELDKQERGAGNEVQLTDAMAKTMDRVDFRGLRFDGRRYDCGSKIGFIEANIAFALDRDDLRDRVQDLLENFTK